MSILPDAPALPGLSFRHFNDEDDFAAMVRVIEGCQEYDHVDPLSPEAGIPSVKELAESFSEAQNIDLQKDLLLVEVDHEIIGFQWLRWWTQADGTWTYYHRGRILPAWRGRGIGTATLHWAERRIRELVKLHPTTLRAIFRANTTSHEKEYNELLLTEGYLPVHSFIELGYDPEQVLPDVTLPDGFTIMAATPEHYRAVWQANEEAFADEWERVEPTELDYVRFLGNPHFDPSLWQVAWHDGAVAGVALCEMNERGVGEITDLSVRKPFRGHGLARTLVVYAVRTLQTRQPKHIRIFTDRDDPFGARKLYESVGFRVLTEYIRYQKEVL
jgi:GNAT superfamily N-acetyltransferase